MNEKEIKEQWANLVQQLCALTLLTLGILKYKILEILYCGAFVNGFLGFFFILKKNVSSSCYKKTVLYIQQLKCYYSLVGWKKKSMKYFSDIFSEV